MSVSASGWSGQDLTSEQSRAIASLVREEIARRRISRQYLADEAKISISTLEKAGYVKVEKDFHNNRPRTRVSMTRPGRRAFQAYVDYLKDILEPG